MYSLTIFKNQYDNKTHRRMDFDKWSQFSKFLYKLSKIPLGGKWDAQLISPASYMANTTRSNKSVLAWESWCAVDVDDIDINGAEVENVISYSLNLPKELDLHRFIDYNKMYDKSFVEPIRNILETLGWDDEPQATLEEFFG